MSEYGSGLTMGQCATYDKERVEHAMHGELACGEDEGGFVYEPATREECESYILGVVDKWYFEAKRLADSGRATERIMQQHGWHVDLVEYMREMAYAEREHRGEYVYERDLRQPRDEIREIEEGKS